MQRRVIPDLEIKLLTLHAVDLLGGCTNLQLLQFMVDNDLMDYFTLQLCLGELTDTRQLVRETHPAGAIYAITGKGREALVMFLSRVPNSRVKLVEREAPMWRARFAREKQLLTRVTQNPTGEFTAHMQIMEGDMPLLEITVALPAQDMAHDFADSFREHAGELYAHIMRTLGGGEAP